MVAHENLFFDGLLKIMLQKKKMLVWISKAKATIFNRSIILLAIFFKSPGLCIYWLQNLFSIFKNMDF